MNIVKINIHKVNAERSLLSKGVQIRINNNVAVKDLEEMSFAVDGKKGLKFTFAFNCNYEPDLGKIEVEGQVLAVDDEKKVKDLKKNWDKDKKIPVAIMELIVNAALHKGNIQAIKISEDVNLPSPLPLPKVRAGKEETKEEK